MKTLTATVPGKTERMARRFLRDGLLSALTTGRDGIGWEIQYTYADMLWFAPDGEDRRRWIDFPPPDQFLRDFPEECEYCESPEEVEATVASRRRICSDLLAEALHLIDWPPDVGMATTGEFLFQFAEHSLPITVSCLPESAIQRLEMRFTATPGQRESAHQVSQWRLENPAPCAPGAAEEPAPQAPPNRPLISRVRDFIIPILIWSFAAIISIVTAFTFPLSSIVALLWGVIAVPL